jgi:hypothetical protein
VKGQLVRTKDLLVTSPHLRDKCLEKRGNLNVSESYGPPQPVTKIAYLYHYTNNL